MDNFNNNFNNAGQSQFGNTNAFQNTNQQYANGYPVQNSGVYQNATAPNYQQSIEAYYQQPTVEQNAVAFSNPQSANNQNAPTPEYESDSVMFCDPNSYVPQSLRQYNTRGKYFTTRGVDKWGREAKFYFTQEERDYLNKYGIKAQEFYNKYQAHLGGEYVKGDPTTSKAFVGPSYQNPDSFVPGDMRKSCPDRNYAKFVIRDEVGNEKEVYLTQEEIEFTRVANMDISTYVNVYQCEFDYDKGQMERSAVSQSAQNVASASYEKQMTRTPSGATS